MSKSQLQYFTKAGDQMNALAMPGSSFVTDAVDMRTYSGRFIIQVKRTATVGDVTFIVEYSNDGITWSRYTPLADDTGAPITPRTQIYYPQLSTPEIPISTTTNQAII